MSHRDTKVLRQKMKRSVGKEKANPTNVKRK